MHTFYPEVPFMKTQDVPTPRYAHDGDAGLDLVATKDVTLRPGESCKMGSGISVAIPKGFAGFVVPRSGLGSKGLVIRNTPGIIDATYRGEIGLTLMNNNPTHVWDVELTNTYGEITSEQVRPAVNADGGIIVHKGDRVAQLIIVPIATVSMVQVATLDETERNTGGFGSTGVRYERP